MISVIDRFKYDWFSVSNCFNIRLMLFAFQYLTQLEIELQEFTTQNQKLKEENQALKQRLSVIQREVWFLLQFN